MANSENRFANDADFIDRLNRGALQPDPPNSAGRQSLERSRLPPLGPLLSHPSALGESTDQPTAQATYDVGPSAAAAAVTGPKPPDSETPVTRPSEMSTRETEPREHVEGAEMAVAGPSSRPGDRTVVELMSRPESPFVMSEAQRKVNRYRNLREAEIDRRKRIRCERWDDEADAIRDADASFPRTDEREYGRACDLTAAMKNLEGCDDNAEEVDHWKAKVLHQAAHVEQAAWKFMESLLDYHKQGGPRTHDTKPLESFKGRFGEHFDKICGILKVRKSKCRDIFSCGDSLRKLVDDPTGVLKQTAKNQCSNNRRRQKIKAGEKAQEELDRQREATVTAGAEAAAEEDLGPGATEAGTTRPSRKRKRIVEDDEDIEDRDPKRGQPEAAGAMGPPVALAPSRPNPYPIPIPPSSPPPPPADVLNQSPAQGRQTRSKGPVGKESGDDPPLPL